MDTSHPLISVVLPVYNGEKYIQESINSILNQTYQNFELVVVNDGSNDNSEEIILGIKSSKIKYFHKKNSGLADTLNFGVSVSHGKYIARQDQDDISHADRFEKQINYLEKNANVVLLGARAMVFTNDLVTLKYLNHATKPCDLRFDLLFDNPFVHSSVMFRKEEFLKLKGYNVDRSFFEDYELWSRFSEIGDVSNLGEVLVDYRHHDAGLSKTSNYFAESAVFAQNLKNYESLFGNIDPAFVEISALMHGRQESYRNLKVEVLNREFDKIKEKIITLYPDFKNEVTARTNQYKSVILYRINMIRRIKYKNNPLIVFLLRVQYRLFRYKNVVTNE